MVLGIGTFDVGLKSERGGRVINQNLDDSKLAIGFVGCNCNFRMNGRKFKEKVAVFIFFKKINLSVPRKLRIWRTNLIFF